MVDEGFSKGIKLNINWDLLNKLVKEDVLKSNSDGNKIRLARHFLLLIKLFPLSWMSTQHPHMSFLI